MRWDTHQTAANSTAPQAKRRNNLVPSAMSFRAPRRDLTPADVDSYISRRRSEEVSDHTIAKELVTLRAALRLAKRAGLWLGEIDALLPAGFAPEYRPRTRALSSEELGQLLAMLPTARAAQVALIVATSACWSEAVRARRDDVQLESGWVHIRGTKRAARDRRIAVRHPALGSLLLYALKHAPGQDELFPRWSNVRRDLLLACAQAGIEKCSPNDLRRTYAKWMRLARVWLRRWVTGTRGWWSAFMAACLLRKSEHC